MCCFLTNEATEQMLALIKRRGSRWFYKVVEIVNGRAESIHGDFKKENSWKVGINTAKFFEIYGARGEGFQYRLDNPKGIHAWNNLIIAKDLLKKQQAGRPDRTFTILPVLGRVKKFLVASTIQSVFIEVEVKQADWKKYIVPAIVLQKKQSKYQVSSLCRDLEKQTFRTKKTTR